MCWSGTLYGGDNTGVGIWAKKTVKGNTGNSTTTLGVKPSFTGIVFKGRARITFFAHLKHSLATLASNSKGGEGMSQLFLFLVCTEEEISRQKRYAVQSR